MFNTTTTVQVAANANQQVNLGFVLPALQLTDAIWFESWFVQIIPNGTGTFTFAGLTARVRSANNQTLMVLAQNAATVIANALSTTYQVTPTPQLLFEQDPVMFANQQGFPPNQPFTLDTATIVTNGATAQTFTFNTFIMFRIVNGVSEQ